MAKGIPGSSHTRYQLGQVRKDTQVASKYHPTSVKASKGQTATKGSKKGC